MATEQRRMQVLSAIVQDYVASSEPVGSRAIVERHKLGVSPATVRNDMAFLEEAGLITQPHTSAGRIPTDLGYRTFVDRIEELKPLSAAERRAIEHFLVDAVDLDDILERTVRLLAQATHQVAIIQYPSLSRASLRHLELLRLSDHHALVVVITDTGRVEQRMVEVEEALPELDELRLALNTHLVGKRLAEFPESVDAMADALRPDQLPVVEAIIAPLVDALRQEAEERIVLAGTANLVRTPEDFRGTIGPILDALEEQVVMLRLLQQLAVDDTVAVSIGAENHYEGLVETSLVTTSYAAGNGPAGALAVLGPTRMDYPSTMASVRAVARYVSEFLNVR
ncbi:MAG TPA: heat-inducible transcriptional repressor HrcA [Actinomycetaceae bacterium]|nr:heat-inducible transcriptional repressor HrcA [Actinomycetaceae bacterium]